MKKIKIPTFIIYVAISLATSFINVFIFWLLLKIFVDNHILCNIIAWIITIAITFVLNQKIVFKTIFSSKKEICKQLLFFYILRLTSLLIDTCVLEFCITKFAMNELVAKLIANVSTTFNNYLLSKYTIFKRKNNL